MALTEFQRSVCRLIARQRLESGESYVAGAVALNTLAEASRISRDIDLFHDKIEAVASSWTADSEVLRSHGFEVSIQKERAGFVEAEVRKDRQSVMMQWTADSAFRFFPLIQHEDFGLTLHPFDLATNKVLALVGRLEARDWIDVINCHDRIQRLGYLAWAASGKDPGFSPAAILEHAGRSARYSQTEIDSLSFDGPVPEAAELSQRWHAMLNEAREIVAALPPMEIGKCVLDGDSNLFVAGVKQLREALANLRVNFHKGCLYGAFPQPRED
jgi:hypothetical protein